MHFFFYDKCVKLKTSNSFRVRIKQDDSGNSEDRTFVSIVVFA